MRKRLLLLAVPVFVCLLVLFWAAPTSVGAAIDGQSLAPPGRAQAGGVITYVVKRGDTLSAIARRYGLGVREVASYNGIANPDRIYVGQVLRIPRPAPPAPTPLPCPCEEITILKPARNAVITSPVTVSGVAASSFEQTVVVAVLDGSGQRIGIAPGIITGEYGQRGPFSVTVPFTMPADGQPGRIQVFTESPRDGATEHLSSVSVQLQGLGLEVLLEQLDAAVRVKEHDVLRALMGPNFRLGLYMSEWVELTPVQAIAQLGPNYLDPGTPRLDFSVDVQTLLEDRATWPSDVIHVVFSTGWGANRDDDAFLLISDAGGRARWTGLLYVFHDLIDYR